MADARIDHLEAEVLGLKKQLGVMRSALQDAGLLAAPEKGACRLGYDGVCPEAKPYQYQKGCRNEQCRTANRKYYSKDKDVVVEEPVATPKRKVLKK